MSPGASLKSIFLLTSLVTILLSLSSRTNALDAIRAVDKICGGIEVIYVRGSGQNLEDREYDKIKNSLIRRLEDNRWTTNLYELGKEAQAGEQYPAVTIGPSGQKVDAKLGLGSGTYRASVYTGTQELLNYMMARVNKCPDSKYILLGYSQGAHVIGDALGDFSSTMLGKVSYVGYFGDPRLWLPEGRGIIPAACRGSELSKWRRGTPSCTVSGGSLSGRNPYVPSVLVDKIGSWCDKKDYICTNQLYRGKNNSHSEYSQKNAEIDQAAREIAKRIGVNNPALPSFANRINATSLLKNSLDLDTFDDPVYVDEIIIVPSQDEYFLQPNDTAYFDVSQSDYDYAKIGTYSWDFENDGVIDAVTDSPVVEHTYLYEFEGTARVVVVDVRDERFAEMILPIHVSTMALVDMIPEPVSNLVVVARPSTDESREVTLSWDMNLKANGYFIYVDDVLVSATDELASSIEIENVAVAEDTIFKVTAVNEFGNSIVQSITLFAVPLQSPVNPPTLSVQSKACQALLLVKKYTHPIIYNLLWKALGCK